MGLGFFGPEAGPFWSQLEQARFNMGAVPEVFLGSTPAGGDYQSLAILTKQVSGKKKNQE